MNGSVLEIIAVESNSPKTWHDKYNTQDNIAVSHDNRRLPCFNKTDSTEHECTKYECFYIILV